MKTDKKVEHNDRSDLAAAGADRFYRIHCMSRRQRGGAGETKGGQVPAFGGGLGGEALATPVVLLILLETMGVIPKQTVA